MKLIVDASVAVKWLFTEDGTPESRRLLAHGIHLHAPDFIATYAALPWPGSGLTVTVRPET